MLKKILKLILTLLLFLGVTNVYADENVTVTSTGEATVGTDGTGVEISNTDISLTIISEETESVTTDSFNKEETLRQDEENEFFYSTPTNAEITENKDINLTVNKTDGTTETVTVNIGRPVFMDVDEHLKNNPITKTEVADENNWTEEETNTIHENIRNHFKQSDKIPEIQDIRTMAGTTNVYFGIVRNAHQSYNFLSYMLSQTRGTQPTEPIPPVVDEKPDDTVTPPTDTNDKEDNAGNTDSSNSDNNGSEVTPEPNPNPLPEVPEVNPIPEIPLTPLFPATPILDNDGNPITDNQNDTVTPEQPKEDNPTDENTGTNITDENKDNSDTPNTDNKVEDKTDEVIPTNPPVVDNNTGNVDDTTDTDKQDGNKDDSLGNTDNTGVDIPKVDDTVTTQPQPENPTNNTTKPTETVKPVPTPTITPTPTVTPSPTPSPTTTPNPIIVPTQKPITQTITSNKTQEEKVKWTCADEGKVWNEEKQMCVGQQSYSYKVPNTAEKDNMLIYILSLISSLGVLGFIINNKKTKVTL